MVLESHGIVFINKDGAPFYHVCAFFAIFLGAEVEWS